MKSHQKTKTQLTEELKFLRQQINALKDEKAKRKQAEKNLKESEKKLQSIIETIPDVVYRLDVNGKISFISDAIKKYGYNPKKLIGTPILKLIHPEDKEKAIYRINERRTGKRSTTSFEVRLLTKNFKGVSFEIKSSDIKIEPTLQIEAEGLYSSDKPDTEGFIGTQGIARDITDHKRVKQALEESKKRYEMATKAGKVGVWDWNLETNQIYIDPNLKALLGYTDNEIKNHLDDWKKHIHPGDAEEVMIKVEEHLKGLTPYYEIEHRMLHRDGSIRWFLARGKAIRDEIGNPYRIVGTDTDITKRKQAEEELKKSQQQLRNLSAHLQTAREEERKLMAREIHDELGQVLTIMKINSHMLKLNIAGKEDTELRELISKETDSFSNFIDKAINSIRKIVSNLSPEFLEELGLTAAIQKYVEQFQKQTKIRCYLKSNLEDKKFDLNLSLTIFRIFQEALTNVARHANASRIDIRLNHTTRNLSLKVKDNGRGIAKKEINNSKSLGLIGMQERALLNGGKLDITGIPGKGTTTILKIPLKYNNI